MNDPVTNPATRPLSEGRRTTLIIVALAVLVGAAAIYFGVLRTAPPPAPPPARDFAAVAFSVLSGEGGPVAEGLELRQVGANGQGVIAALVNGLPADTYRRITFEADGLEAAVGAGVYWHRKDNAQNSLFRALTLEQVRRGELELGAQDQWSGEIETFGFVIQGPLGRPIILRKLSFSVPAAAE